jgi:tetratricopeptide (TPR) repeat protein
MRRRRLLITGCSLLCMVAFITIIAICMRPSVTKRAADGLASFEAAQRDFSAAQYKPAESEARRAVKLFGQLVREVPKQKDYHVKLGHSQWQLGDVLSATGRPDEAERVLDEALQVFQKAAVKFPTDPFMRQEQAWTLVMLGSLMESNRRLDEAEQRYRSAAEVYAALKQQFPKKSWYLHEEGYATWMLAGMLQRAGRQDEAEAEFRQAIKLHEQGIQDFPNELDFKARLSAIRGNLANLLRAEGKSAEADAIPK